MLPDRRNQLRNDGTSAENITGSTTNIGLSLQQLGGVTSFERVGTLHYLEFHIFVLPDVIFRDDGWGGTDVRRDVDRSRECEDGREEGNQGQGWDGKDGSHCRVMEQYT